MFETQGVRAASSFHLSSSSIRVADKRRRRSSKSEEGQRHLDALQRAPVLERDEELRLARAAKKGDQDARAELITRYQRLVMKVAAQVQRQQGDGVDFDDLVSEGNVGLLRAVARFDPARGVRLVHFARLWVRSSMTSLYAREHSHDVRLDAGDDDGPDLCSEAPTPEDAALQDEQHRHTRALVARALETLDARERLVVQHRLLADAEDVWTHERLAQRLGYSRVTVWRLEAQVVEKLRALLEGLTRWRQ